MTKEDEQDEIAEPEVEEEAKDKKPSEYFSEEVWGKIKQGLDVCQNFIVNYEREKGQSAITLAFAFLINTLQEIETSDKFYDGVSQTVQLECLTQFGLGKTSGSKSGISFLEEFVRKQLSDTNVSRLVNSRLFELHQYLKNNVNHGNDLFVNFKRQLLEALNKIEEKYKNRSPQYITEILLFKKKHGIVLTASKGLPMKFFNGILLKAYFALRTEEILLSTGEWVNFEHELKRTVAEMNRGPSQRGKIKRKRRFE